MALITEEKIFGKIGYKVLFVSVAFGLLAWILDALLDYLFFYEGTFAGLLISDVPPHEVYFRLLLLGFFVVFGVIASRLVISQKRSKDRADHLNRNRVLRALRNVNQLITREKDRESLLQRTCESIIETWRYNLAWIALPDEDGKADFAAHAGLGDASGAMKERVEGGNLPDCAGKALSEQTPRVIDDPYVSCPDCPLSGKYPGMSNIAVRLECEGKVYGLLSMSTPARFAGDPEEVSLIGEVAGDIAFALHKIETEEERERAEEALRENEKRYRELFDSIRDAILVADTDRNIIDCNRAFTEKFGYRLDEIKGKKTVYVYDNEEEYERMGKEIRKHVHRPHFVYTINYRKKSGEVFPGETNVFYLRDSNDEIAGFIGVIRDVSKRRQLEEQLNQAMKMEAVGRLAGGVAHDFNNNLVPIMNVSDMLLKELDVNHPMYEDMREIRDAGQRCVNLTRQLLAFSRKQILQVKVLDLNEVVGSVEKMLRHVIGEDIKLETHLAPELGRVKADTGQLEQVLANLAVNSRDAMPGGGKLTVETKNVYLDEDYANKHFEVTPGPYVMLAVSDTGVGMDEEIRSRIFEPFFTTKEKGRGTGLGMATVYGIVKQLGGNIWCYSEPGEGTSFKIYLPAVEEEAEESEELKRVSAEENYQGSETVLVVEDDPAVLRVAKRLLSESGYEVLEAADGEEALELCERHSGRIEVVITDVVMPGISGKELVEKAMEICPGVKVIYVSGYTDNAIVHHGVLDPGTEFIQKPFTAESLLGKVRKVLDS